MKITNLSLYAGSTGADVDFFPSDMMASTPEWIYYEDNPVSCTEYLVQAVHDGQYIIQDNPCKRCFCAEDFALTCMPRQCRSSVCGSMEFAAAIRSCCKIDCGFIVDSTTDAASAAKSVWHYYFKGDMELLVIFIVCFTGLLLILALLGYWLRTCALQGSSEPRRETESYLSCREDGSSIVSRYPSSAVSRYEVSINVPSVVDVDNADLPRPPPYQSPKCTYLPPPYSELLPRYEDLITAS